MTDQMINDMAAAIDSLRRQVLIAHQELRAITVQRNGYISQAQELAARVSELEAENARLKQEYGVSIEERDTLPFEETPAPESGMMDGNNV